MGKSCSLCLLNTSLIYPPSPFPRLLPSVPSRFGFSVRQTLRQKFGYKHSGVLGFCFCFCFWLYFVLFWKWENEKGKKGNVIKCALMSRLPLRAVGAEFHWGPFEKRCGAHLRMVSLKGEEAGWDGSPPWPSHTGEGRLWGISYRALPTCPVSFPQAVKARD